MSWFVEVKCYYCDKLSIADVGDKPVCEDHLPEPSIDDH